DSCFEGKRIDESGKYLIEKSKENGWYVLNYEIVPDEKEIIEKKLIEFSENCDLILTTGGTGFSERDVTPEATENIIEKKVPGISEILRIKTYEKSRFSVLSRGISGIRGKTLIINLPGSLNGVIESFEILNNLIVHSIEMIRGFTHEKDVKS
ncbi:MAG: MogA/MoaB family molybdenum cofactor biosynthesis protein, partial [Candidatus Ratteibacteria bacterium]